MPRLRGRAAQPLRPGFIAKAVLSGDIPLTTGEPVKEAAITDVHSVYRFLTKQENLVRPRDKKLRGMSYRSFATLFRFAYLLGLVERVREEPMLFPPPGGGLLSIRKPNGAHIVEAKRIIYRLTSVGVQDELAWSNLCKAWIEHWPVPQKAEEVVPPVIPPPVAKPPRVVKPPLEVEKLKWVEVPSIAQFKRLLKHLKGLQAIGIEDVGAREEVDRLSMRIGGWDIWVDDSLEDAKAAKHAQKIGKFTLWKKFIVEVMEGLMDEDLPRAIRGLERLI